MLALGERDTAETALLESLLGGELTGHKVIGQVVGGGKGLGARGHGMVSVVPGGAYRRLTNGE
jgi:hypothetical protein